MEIRYPLGRTPPPEDSRGSVTEEQTEDSSAAAAALYAEYRRLVEAGETPDFEELCRSHPELADELRRLLAGEEAPAYSESFTGNPTLIQPESGGGASSAPLALEAGAVLADYRLLGFLGRGDLGEVWEAEESPLGRRVALKVLRADRLGRRTREWLEREGKALARVNHPGVVTVYRVGHAAGHSWIAQELVAHSRTYAEVLSSLKRQDSLPEDHGRRTAQFFQELAGALHAVHEAGVVHRDLKPANVIVTPDGRPKVADFGVAMLRDELQLEEEGSLLGTLSYMSPEQVAGGRYGIDRRADVFALGVMLHEALALERPFRSAAADRARAREEVLEQIAAGEPAPLTGAPAKLASIAARALAKDRGRRYQDTASLAEDLRRYLVDEPLQVESDDATPQRDGDGGPPRRVAGYRLERLLGRGGQAEVWEAVLEATGGRYALKLLSVEGKSQAELDRFEREAAVGSRRPHPGLIPVFAAGRDGPVHWIAMELVEGGRTLRDLIQSAREQDQRTIELEAGAPADVPGLFGGRSARRERYRRVAEFFAELTEALAGLHATGILHRDLKPANVLVTPEGRPRLTDFGSVRVVDERTLHATGELAGTPRYMSPEQLNPKVYRDKLDGRSDVFSLGVMLYETLALAHPFEGDALAVREKILEDEPAPLARQARELPGDLAVIAHHALEKRRAGRYGSMSEVAADLRRLLADEPIHARPPSPARRAAKWVRRHRTLSLVTAVIFLALTVVSAALAYALSVHERQQAYAARGTLEELREAVPRLLRSGYGAEAEFESWLRRGEWLRSQRSGLEERLTALRGRTSSGEPELLAEIATIQTLLAEMDVFYAGEAALGAGQGVFHELVRVRGASLTSEEARRRWIEAREEGLLTRPRAGLLPLHREAADDLWELVDLYTGAEPTGREAGAILPDAETGVILVEVPGGSFWMGAQAEDAGAPGYDPAAGPDEAPPHRVEVPPFLLSKLELTQGQYARVMAANPSHFQGDPLLPVEFLSREDCEAFCRVLGWRLPSEAEWEYACRAGTETPWFTGASLEQNQANFSSNATRPVMSYPPNPWGFHDMHGNVWEWCQDAYDRYEVSGRDHPAAHVSAAAPGTVHVIRGGSFWVVSGDCRSACRNWADPGNRVRDRGFRVAAAVRPGPGS